MDFQGVALESIASEFGTPTYVYDGEKIAAQYRRFERAFFGLPLKVRYACKALTNVSVLRLIKSLGSGIDVVSYQELELAVHAGFEPAEILFTPNCAEYSEYARAVEHGVQINIDSLPVLERFGADYGDSVPVCLRINPHILAGGHRKIQVGHSDSKFGISLLQLEEIVEVVSKHSIRVNGLHMHTGSDILEPDVFLTGAEILFDAARAFKDLEFIDLGSGFKVAYREGDIVTDIERLGKQLKARWSALCERYGSQLDLWFEPGKFLVSEAGVLLVEATNVKKTPGSLFVGVNSGLNHLIRPMMYDAYHEVVNLSNPNGETHVYSVVGYICETDTLAADRELPEVRTGDILAFKNAGAYAFSMASNYNSRLRPAEVLVHKGEARLIREPEQFEDLLRHQVEISL